jgi:cytochrome c2
MLRRPLPASLVWLAALVAVSILGAVAAGATLYWQTRSQTRTTAEAITQGSVSRGKQAIYRYGCAACHAIPGIRAGSGQVGPDLTDVARRAQIAGKLANDPETMTRWLMHPQALDPGNGMPEMGVTRRDAQDMAAYLYSTY